MKPSYLTFRLFTEVVAIIASVEAAIMFLLPVIAPGVSGAAGAMLDTAMLTFAAGPLILWRMNAAVKRAGDGNKTDERQKAKFPVQGLALVLVLTLTLLTATILVAINHVAWSRDDAALLNDLQGRVLVLDERLTMSARLAAATGDTRWEERYRTAEKDLDAVLKAFDALLDRLLGQGAEKARAALAATSHYNDALVALENQCFAQVRTGDRAGAIAAVMTDEYDRLKGLFAQAAAQADAETDRLVDNANMQDRQYAFTIAWMGLLSAVVMSVAMAWSVGRSRARAIALAAEMTGDLRASEVGARAALARLAAYRAALDEQVVITMTDTAGTITEVNDLFCHVSGYSREKLIGADHRLVNSGHHPEAFWAEMWEVITRGDVWRGEVCNKAEDGSLFWLDTTIGPMRDGAGRIIGYVAVRIDISERRRAEEALRVSEERFRAIADYTSDWENWVGTDGRLLWLNPAVERMTGYTVEECLAMPDYPMPMIHEDDRERIAAAFREAVHGSSGKDVEFRMLRKDGAAAWFSVTWQPIYNAAGVSLGHRSSLHDITERKKAQEELESAHRSLEARVRERTTELSDANAALQREVEERKRFEAVTNRVFTLSLDLFCIANPQGYFTRVNPAFEQTLGWTADEMISKPFIEFVHPDDRAATLAELAKLNSGAPVFNFSNRYRCKDGSLRWLEWKSTSADAVIYAVARDITARKRTDEALRVAREAADAANLAKGEFLATMSHELRTPLNGVIGMMELLLHTQLNPQQLRYTSLAKASSDMLLSLISDILDFSKIEAGRLEMESTGFDLHYAVENAGACFSSRAASKGLELICAVHPAVPRRLQGDPGRLQQVLTNLVGNAIKFTDKGEVVIRVTKDEETDHDVTVRFTVTDTGIGIPSERVDRLFMSFSQIDSSTTRKYGGTGLGLAICKRLVEAMGGEIGVTSAEGRGATFWFIIKFVKQAEHADQVPSLPDDIRRVRVLAVDDNATNREILHEQLAGWGLDHETTACGQDALSALRAAHREGRPFGIVIVDQHMPEMDGEQLAREIKQDPAVADTALVLLTSSLECDEPKRLMEIGFAGWLSKPALPSHLLDTLLEAFVCARAFSRRLPEELRESSPPLMTKSQSAGARILLAEDHEISQEVASTILRRAGFLCDVVSNGKEAVEAVKSAKYDLVLMDCQMPEMDGFQATQAIRSLERDRLLSGGPNERIPIIALTANAMRGDRERCLAAGMDDYGSKPLDTARLLRLIDANLGNRGQNSVEPDLPEHESGETGALREIQRPSPAFNTEKLLKSWGNDQPFLQRLIAKFSARAPDDLRKLREAIERNDATEAQRLAHGLKGAAGYVAAEKVWQLAAKLEVMARGGNWGNAGTLLQELDAELQRCIDDTHEGSADLEVQSKGAYPIMGESP